MFAPRYEQKTPLVQNERFVIASGEPILVYGIFIAPASDTTAGGNPDSMTIDTGDGSETILDLNTMYANQSSSGYPLTTRWVADKGLSFLLTTVNNHSFGVAVFYSNLGV